MNVPSPARAHPEPPALSLPPPEALGTAFPPFAPLFGKPEDEGHAAIRALPLEGALIHTHPRGFLRPADALTLHEAARHGTGDVLELGSAWGLSTTILCRAVRARGTGRVVSIEIDPAFQAATTEAVHNAGLAPWHEMRPGDAGPLLQAAASSAERFGTIFIDHDHGLEATRHVCRLLPHLLLQGGLAIFHDMNDARNTTGEYGVHQALAELLANPRANTPRFTLRALPGCCAVVQRA